MKEIESAVSYDIAGDVYASLKAEFRSEDSAIDEILADIFSRHGKVIRPFFMDLIGSLLGGNWQSMKKAAVVIEAVHVASLIHDDVVDSSSLRRGKVTLNARYTDKMSVLFGDLVFLKALEMSNSIDDIRAPKVINRAVERMISGEISEEFSDINIDEATYLKTISDKTASLFAASGELAAMLSGSDSQTVFLARELGECIGMAFQIVDDTLDFTGDTKVMGKPCHIDALSGSYTLPVIHVLSNMTNSEKEHLIESGSFADEIADTVRNNGGIEYAYKRAREYSEKARGIFMRLGIHGEDAFDSFLERLVDRVR